MTTQKKPNWRLVLGTLGISLLLGYLLGGLFILPGLTLETIQKGIAYILLHPFKHWWNEYSRYVLLGVVMVWMIGFSYYLSNQKNFMFGREYGSARWEDIKKFNRKYADYMSRWKNPKNYTAQNRILSMNARISYNTSKTLLNNNQFVVGGSGAGKTAFFVTPNLYQCYGSNVYTDPKGDTLKENGRFLEAQGIVVKSINLCDMRESCQYNPFKYIRNQQDLQKLITNLIANTTPAESHAQDPFWEKAETLYLTAIFSYVWKCCPRDDEVVVTKTFMDPTGMVYEKQVVEHVHMERNFRTVLMLLDEAEVPANEKEESPLTKRMKKLARSNKLGKHHIAVRNYFKCIRGAGDTVRSIIISANARFAPFDNEDLLRILDDDDIDLGSLGIGLDGDEETKTSLFCIIPDDDTTFNFVPGMLYTQLFQELYRQARYHGGRLPIDVGFWLDEFANIKMPDSFDKILATCRSRGIYCTIILQNLAQIKDLYEKKWESVVGNCDTFIYLGGNEDSTHEYISKKIGKWTIDKRSNGQTLGQHGSTSRTDDILGRELMTPDEVAHMDNNNCIVFVRGAYPIFDRKWFLFNSKEYAYARSFGDFKNRPEIKEDKDSGRLTTVKKKRMPRQLSEKSIEYYKGAYERGEEIIIEDMTLVEFLSADYSEHSNTDEEVNEAVLKSWDQIQERIQKRNARIAKMEEQKDGNGSCPDSPDQKEEVRESKPAKATSLFEVIKNDSLSEEQLHEIRQGLLDGLSEAEVLTYAESGNSPQRMAMIRKFLQK